jgi:uncharacterized protein (DUF2147 family)
MTQFFTRSLLILGLGLLMAADVHAQNTPVGTWRTIDDNTGQVRSHVEITQQPDGTFEGYIRHLTDATRRNAVCEACPEDWGRNERLVGLKILQNVRERGGEFRNGQILDPEEGKVYGVRLRPIENGQKLEVRGFLRVPLMGSALGRTQVWERID